MIKLRSLLYRLIEAGQLTHKALLTPLLERGLEPGDDAVLFLLAAKHGASDAALAAGTGLTPEALAPRLDRLTERDLIVRMAQGAQLLPGYALTERGHRVYQALDEAWNQLETALLDELKPKQRRQLRQRLGRFVTLLRS